MKLLLSLSLILNCVLLLLAGRPGGRQTQEKPVPRVPRANVIGSGKWMRTSAPASASVPRTPWSAIETRDIRKLIANLRALGCPEQTLRDLITLRVCREYRKKFVELQAESLRSWDYTRNRNYRDTQSYVRDQRRIRTEMDGELERLLGVPASQLQATMLGWGGSPGWNDFLPLDKQAQVREIKARYQDLADDIRGGLMDWESDPARDAQLKELYRQKQAELAAILTPQELAALNLRESPAAEYARKNLPEAKSEAEFAKMVHAVETVGIEEPKWDPTAGLPSGLAFGEPADNSAYEQKRTELDALLKRTLGEDRVAEQQQENQMREAEGAQREKDQNEARERARIVSLADSVGIGEDDANRFLDRLLEIEPAMRKKFSELEKQLEHEPDKEKKLEAAALAEMEKIAVEMLGEKGRVLARKMTER
jgi:hypothetical protein